MAQRQSKSTRAAREQAHQPMGRRARQRAEQEQAARRRRLALWLGGGTILIVAAIIIVAVLLNRPSNAAASLVNLHAHNHRHQPPHVCSTAPDFNLATLDGTHYQHSALLGH